MARFAARFRWMLPVLALGLALWGGVVSADELIQTEPHIGETIDHAPEAIVLTFDEPLLLEPGRNSVAIIGENDERLDDGQAQIAAFSARSMVVRPRPGVELEGEIEIVYSVSFGSGASAAGSFDFAVDPQAEPEVGAPPPASEPRSSESIVLWTIAILAGVSLFTLLAYYLRYATDNARSSVADSEEASH